MENNRGHFMKTRWITAAIGIPLTFGIWSISHLWQEIPMLILILFSGLIINYEIFMMSKDKVDFRYPFFRIGIMMTLSLLFSYLYGMRLIDFVLFINIHFIFFMIFLYWIIGHILFKAYDISKNFEHIGVYTIIYITLVILLPQVFLLKVLYSNMWALALLFIFCWMSDAFALFIGSTFGKNTLSNIPSRSKTIEGYIGSFICTIFLGILFYYIQGILYLPFQWTLTKWIFFAISINISSGFGDLLESLIKRWCNKKDSSSILPGMGGLFDAIDAQIYSIPIILFFFKI